MQFHRTVLPNGLRVITIPMPAIESATVLLMVRAGSRYEEREGSGISHFLEHMAFKGTKKRPTALSISTVIDGIGGEFNAFTGKETTGYYIKSQSSHIDLSMDVLSDMLQHSLFDPVEIDKERGVILEEINLYEDTPMRKIGDIYESLLYGDTPMGWDVGGFRDVIKKVQREDFVSYLASLYSAHNMMVVVAGGISEKDTGELVTKHFGNMSRFAINRYSKVVEKQEKPMVLIRRKQTEQAHIAMGFRTVPIDHVDRYPLAVLSAILGGGMSSRLFHEVREKRGLAYYVRSQSEHYQDCGSLVTLSGVDAKRVEEAVSVILSEHYNIAHFTSHIADDELCKAKEFIKGHLVLELEDSRAVAGFFATQEMLETAIDKPEDVLIKIDKVTKEQVQSAAAKYFVEKHLNLAIIGNFEEGERWNKLLSL